MNSLNIYNSKSSKAAYNLALEEHLLLSSKDDILLFYFNRDAVIIGKHQNPWKEVNIDFCTKNNIEIRRRLSGGGTVFHDLNNLNFSYIRNKETDFVNFREHIKPISEALQLLGIENQITDRNDIFIDDKKISGNAEHVNNTKKRILHHGTLLINSDLTLLRNALAAPASKIDTHAVNSVRSKVSCISKHSSFSNPTSFLNALIRQLKALINIQSLEDIDPEKLPTVQELVSQKYSRWDWNFGHSPQFKYENELGESFTIRKGRYIDIESLEMEDSLKAEIIGKPFDFNQLQTLGVLNSQLNSRITIS